MSDKIQNDVKLLTRYALGYEKEKEYSIQPSQLPQTIALEKGIRGTVSIFPDLKSPKKYITDQKAIEQGLKGSTFKETYGNFKNNIELQRLERRFRPMPAPTAPAGGTVDPKLIREFQKSQHYDRVRQLINEAKTLKGKDYANKMKEIYKEIADADLKLHQELTKGSLKPTTKRGKLWNGIKKYTGTNAAQTAGKKLLAKSGTARAISKFARANAVTAASIDVAISIPEIMQTKALFDQIDEDGNPIEDQFDELGNLIQKGSGKEKLGTQKALKQTGRVLAVSGTQIGAFALGAKLGTAAFAAAWAAKGAALGSVAPGVGTLIGGIVGFAVGLGASYLAGKAAQKVVGKSEIDQFKDKQTEKFTAKAMNDSNVLSEVTDAAADRYVKEVKANGGNDTKETEEIKETYNRVIQAYNNNEIGTKPQEPKPKAENNPVSQATSDAQTSGATQSQVSQESQAPSAAQPTAQAESSQQTSDKSNQKTDKKLEKTITKLDNFIKFLTNFSTQSTQANNSCAPFSPYMPMGFNSGFMSIA